MLSGRPARIRRREFLLRYAGNTMLAAGASLFGAAAAYEIYANRAEAGLGHLKRGTFVLPGGPQQPGSAATVAAAAQPAATDQPSAATAGAEPAAATEPPVASVEATTVPAGAEPALAAAAPAVQAPGVTAGMLPVKIRIQSIGVIDVKVVEVGTRLENGQLVWATADHAVGHNVGSAVPGQPGNMVLSGHISSPVRGEGNVFHSLPSLADKIGSRVAIQNGDGAWFYYDIVGTNVVSPADTWVMDPTPATVVSLLTCVPDGVYTHRFVALGKYVGRA